MKWERYLKEWRANSPKFGPVKIARSKKKYYLLTNPWTGEGIGLGVFDSLEDAKRNANPAKLERCVKKVGSRKVKRGRKKPSNAYAICTTALKGKRRRKNPAWWYIHVQRGRGPEMLWNGKSFNNDPQSTPKPFKSRESAAAKARRLLSLNRTLQHYKIWVSDWFGNAGQKTRRVNPESLDEAAQKLEDFTGMPATHVESVRPRSSQKTGYVLGELDAIGYRARRKGIAGGRTAAYTHKFRKGSRPLLATSTDGKQLSIVGGRYEVTEAGIEDRE